jgi:putative NADH-flavin reductase
MRILVVGATGGLGQDIVAEAVARGHETAALLRDPSRVTFSEAVEIVRGDVLDLSSLTPAVVGRDAVICALGTPARAARPRCWSMGPRTSWPR